MSSRGYTKSSKNGPPLNDDDDDDYSIEGEVIISPPNQIFNEKYFLRFDSSEIANYKNDDLLLRVQLPTELFLRFLYVHPLAEKIATGI